MGKHSLLQEISVGIMSSMIILPPVILMVSLFRKLVIISIRQLCIFSLQGRSQVERRKVALTRYSMNKSILKGYDLVAGNPRGV